MAVQHPQSETQDRDAWLLVGRIGKTHGVVGAVKVWPETDDPARFEDFETVYVGADRGTAEPHAVETVRLQPRKGGVAVVLKLAGIETLEAATALQNLHVFVEPEALPPLDEDEFFLHDLLGLRAVSEEGTPLGTVKDILELPAHPVYVIARPGRPDAMLPAVPAFIAAYDLDEGVLVVRTIEGLFE